MQTAVDVLIIGAGITGLSMARFLQAAGKRVLIVDQGARAGGQMHTVTQDGYYFEKGPNTGVVSNAAVLHLFSLLGDSCQLCEAASEAAVREILYHGRRVPLPNSLWTGLTTPLFSWYDKCNILAEPFRKRGTDALEPIAATVRRRLGESFYDYAVDPFISGIYAGDPERLVTRFALPKLYRLEQQYGSFIRGTIRRGPILKAEKAQGISKRIFSVKGGFSQLINALQVQIGAENLWLQLHDYTLTPATDVCPWQLTTSHGRSVTAPYVVTTVPAYALPQVLPFVPLDDLSPISNMPYAPVIEVGVGIAAGYRLPRAFGLLIPSKECQPLLGVLYNSACYPDKAPQGATSLSVFMGGMRHPEILQWTDDQIRSTVIECLIRYYDLPQDFVPHCLHIFRHAQAIPQYQADTPHRLRALGNIQMQHPGLIIAGGLVDGIGIADRIAQAQRIARLLAE